MELQTEERYKDLTDAELKAINSFYAERDFNESIDKLCERNLLLYCIDFPHNEETLGIQMFATSSEDLKKQLTSLRKAIKKDNLFIRVDPNDKYSNIDCPKA